MRAKALVIFSLVCAVWFLTVSLSWARGGIAHRQTKQFQRIAGGVRSGVITQREFTALSREQRRIKQTLGRARADGRINVRERRRIDTLQDKASKHIYRAKHNQATPYSCESPYGERHFHGKLRYNHHPVYYGYTPATYGFQLRGRYSEPYYSFAWSIGW